MQIYWPINNVIHIFRSQLWPASVNISSRFFENSSLVVCDRTTQNGDGDGKFHKSLDVLENNYEEAAITPEFSSKSGELNQSKKIAGVLPGLEKYRHGNFHVKSFPPSFNFAAYVNNSPSLQELIKLGVSLYKWERRKGVAEFILKLDFERHMTPYIRFLHDVGVDADNLGNFLTSNPFIFQEELDDLNVRINYLQSKKFSSEMISKVISKNPYWLNFSTKRIDQRLGHFQKSFKLSGNEVRQLVVTHPKVITYNMHHIKTNTFVLKEELGLDDKEVKLLLLNKPKLWTISQLALKERFEYVHLEMEIPHELILKSPEVLMSRKFRLKERHLFLQSLKRDQYDPSEVGYVSLKNLVSCSNADFAVHIAKSCVDTYNMFLKTL